MSQGVPQPDLSAVTVEMLTELTNVGTVRRATKELDRVTLALTPAERGWLVTGDDDSRCIINEGSFADWECDCNAGGSCRHVVRAVLWLQQQAGLALPANLDRAPADPSAAEPLPTEPVPSEQAPVEVLDSRTLRQAATRRQRYGLVATVHRGPRTVVRLHAPVEAVVRMGADADPRFARCTCGQPRCMELADALVALEKSGPDGGLVEAGTKPVVVPDLVRRDWDRWWSSLCEVGLGAANELLGGASRLASRCDDAGLNSLGDVMREIGAQLAHHQARDVQVAPDRLVTLIGEFEARLRRLERDPSQIAAVASGGLQVPDLFVAGQRNPEQTLPQLRLVGLGAEYVSAGGWSKLQVFVAEVRSGSVMTLTSDLLAETSPSQTVDGRSPASRLGHRSRGLVSLQDWACGSGLVTAAKLKGSELVLSRLARIAVRPSSTLTVPDGSAVLVREFSDLASPADLPSVLSQRTPTVGVAAAEVATVSWVRARIDGSIQAELVDSAGEVASLELPPAPRELWGVRRTFASALAESAEVRLAGRWVQRGSRPTVRPTALWSAGQVFLTDLGNSDSTVDFEQRVGADPWASVISEIRDAVGRLLVVGAARGSHVPEQLEWLSRRVESYGLLRWAETLRTAAQAVPSAKARPIALADLAVLLAFADEIH